MDISGPKKKCDLIMKGGVTSGVVYPKAISELSKEYQFSSIGGTSAGAIAAAVAAAAEYARVGGKQDAFDEVDKLPEWLGGTSPDGKHSNLFHLFQPQRALSGLYSVATSGLGKLGIRKWLAIFWTLLLKFPLATLIGVAPGILMGWMSLGSSPWWFRSLGLLGAILIGMVGLVLGPLSGVMVEAAAIPKHSWGICSGMTDSGSRDSPPALVPWLANYLDRLAGKNEGEPLTFGDLHQRGISLQMITTNLTNGRPYTIPFGDHTHFYFKSEDLRSLFPDYVVSWMERNPGTRSTRDQSGQVESDGLRVLPDCEKFPVIVAVRMSLSFPLLFRPILLYGIDFGFGPKTPDGKKSIPEPSFFVDGGLANNFPLNLFDRPIPRWPTFGINLRDRNDGRHNQEVYIPCKNSGGLEEWWTRFDERQGLGGLLSYFGLLFDTSRDWRDNLQMNVPGYRDRVVHIGLDPAMEGGLNLDMGSHVIALLTQRGKNASGAVLSRYSPTLQFPRDPNCVVGLDNQKWIRFRSFMELLEESLLSIEEAVGYSGFGEHTYDDLLQQASELSYPMSTSQQQYAIDLLGALMRLVPLIKDKREMGQAFQTRVPKPEPDLRVMPHF